MFVDKTINKNATPLDKKLGKTPSMLDLISSMTTTPRAKSTRAFECHICHKVFSVPDRLKTHIRTVHEKRKDFKCETCGKCFTQKSSLTVHIKTVHQKRRDFECMECGKKFSQASSVKTHIRTVHQKMKIHSCFCGKSFSHSGTLKRHQETFHPDVMGSINAFAGDSVLHYTHPGMGHCGPMDSLASFQPSTFGNLGLLPGEEVNFLDIPSKRGREFELGQDDVQQKIARLDSKIHFLNDLLEQNPKSTGLSGQSFGVLSSGNQNSKSMVYPTSHFSSYSSGKEHLAPHDLLGTSTDHKNWAFAYQPLS
uniref:C2H2-type domain-containing protein n=1 Tax=Mucochytrium quahogii TaxID=96639 RepID=A0A7S2SER1_9STRA|mmetsp:Transcript_18063/g.30763  ORF Transcript_18063/g.30763 Transcript_18063/m.30763 type:complete len:309 (+) Transcript_18063:346-1272(+)